MSFGNVLHKTRFPQQQQKSIIKCLNPNKLDPDEIKKKFFKQNYNEKLFLSTNLDPFTTVNSGKQKKNTKIAINYYHF